MAKGSSEKQNPSKTPTQRHNNFRLMLGQDDLETLAIMEPTRAPLEDEKDPVHLRLPTASNRLKERLESLKLILIDPDPDNPRDDMPKNVAEARKDRSLVQMAESIRKVGQREAISVEKYRGERYRILTGERRYWAHRIAGMETINAVVRDEESDEFIRKVKQIAENHHRRDMSSAQKSKSFAWVLEQCHGDRTEAIAWLSVHRSTFYRYVPLADKQRGATVMAPGTINRISVSQLKESLEYQYNRLKGGSVKPKDVPKLMEVKTAAQNLVDLLDSMV